MNLEIFFYKLKNYNTKYSFELFFGSIVIFIIFFEFFIKNSNQLDTVLIVDTLKWFVILLSINILYFFFFRNTILAFSISCYFFFKFELLRKNFQEFINFDGEISFVIIAISIFFLYFYFKKINSFLKIYILFYLVILIFKFLSINPNIKINQSDDIIASNEIDNFKYFEADELKKIDYKKNRNIYFVILDAMVSLEEFQRQTKGFQKENIIENLKSLNLQYISESKSVFPASHLTFSSIANLDAIKKPNSEKYYNRDNFFPSVLLLPKKHPNYPKLLKALNEIQYTFKWIGSAWADCNKYDENFCLEYDEISGEKNYRIEYILDHNISDVDNFFLSQTPLRSILFNLNYLLFGEKKYSQWEFKANDGIGKFIKSIQYFNFKKDKNYFFWIHHASPHWPYVYDRSCEERIDDSHLSTKNNFKGYKEAYLCNLKKINQFMNYINKHDPRAIVILQGDHGFEFDATGHLKKTGFTKENARKRLDHFNAIKINSSCKKYISSKIGNINAVRLALNCSVNTKPKLIEEKNYIGFYENQDQYGLIFDFSKY